MKKNSTEASFSSYQKFVIFILVMTQFSIILDFMIMSPMGDMLMKALTLKPAMFGAAVSAYAFSAGISGFLIAGFADKFDRKKLLLFFYTGFILGTLLCSIADSYWMLLTARIITGLFGGVIGAISMAIVTDLFDIDHRGRVLGFVQMCFGASQVLGIPISLFLANRWNWHTPFILMAILAALNAIIIFIRLKPITGHLSQQQDRSALHHLIHTFSENRYRIGFLSTAFLSIGGFMMMPFSAAFAINNLKVTQEQLPVLFLVSGFSSLLIMPLVGRLADRMNKFILFSIASALMIPVVVFYTNLSAIALWLVIIFNIIIMMGVQSRMIPSDAIMTELPKIEDRGAFMSINSSMQQVAGGVAAACAGMIVVQKDKFSPLEHYNILGLVMVGLSLFSILLLYRVYLLVKKKSLDLIDEVVNEIGSQ